MIAWFKSKEPVLGGYIVAWVLTNAGAVIVGRTHLITSDQWSTLSNTLTPVLLTVVLGGLAWFSRTVVTPVAKVADQVEAHLNAAPGIDGP